MRHNRVMEIETTMLNEDAVRIKFTRIVRNGVTTPKYSIYYQDRYQGDVFTAKEIEPFIAAIPTRG